MIAKLVFRGLREERARALSAVLGVAAAVGLLTWHLGLACTAIFQGEEAARKAAAPFSAWVLGAATGRDLRSADAAAAAGDEAKPAAKPRGKDRARGFVPRRIAPVAPLPPRLLDALAKSPRIVSGCAPLCVHTVRLDLRPGGRVMQGPPVRAVAAALPDSGIPFQTTLSEGRLPRPGTLEAAVCENLFRGRRLTRPKMGDPLPMILTEGTLSLKIVGLFPASKMISLFPGIYTTREAMGRIAALTPGMKTLPNMAFLTTAPGAAPESVGEVMDTVPEAGACVLSTCRAVAADFRTDTVRDLMESLPLSLSLAVITAACMLATVLAIGLTLRRRQIAELRCAGMTRAGVAGIIAVKTSCLLASGWALGLLAGCAVLQAFLLCEAGGGELPARIHPGWQTPAFTLLLALAVGALGVVVPLFQSFRVKPLEIVGGDIARMRPVSVKKSLLGLLLLLPLPLCAHTLKFAPKPLSACMLAIGIPAFVAGILLCIHPLIRLVELALLRPAGALLGLDPRLLSRRLSRDPGRAAGTLLTLSLGLGGYMAVHIWGGTLMSSYVPSPEWPDVIVSALPGGLSPEQARAAAAVNGFDRPAIPVETTQFRLDDESDDAVEARGLIPPEGEILVFGSDPAAVFGGDKPLADFRFIEGNRRDAARRLAEEDACVIPAMLSRMTGLHRGDSFGLTSGKKLTVAGVVELNWHLFTSRSRVRSLHGRLDGKPPPPRPPRPAAPGKKKRPRSTWTSGMVFVSEKLAREMTGNRERVNFLWGNLNPAYRAIPPLEASVKLDASIRAAIRDREGRAAIQVHNRDEVADGTLSHGNHILGTMARIPFWSLLVTSTGVIVLLIASAQSAREEIGTLRAIGMTEGQLGRLFFGEALLITASSLVLSFVGGGLYGWSFTGLKRYYENDGLPFTLQIPWDKIAQGALFAVFLCLVMSVLPLRGILKSLREK